MTNAEYYARLNQQKQQEQAKQNRGTAQTALSQLSQRLANTRINNTKQTAQNVANSAAAKAVGGAAQGALAYNETPQANSGATQAAYNMAAHAVNQIVKKKLEGVKKNISVGTDAATRAIKEASTAQSAVNRATVNAATGAATGAQAAQTAEQIAKKKLGSLQKNLSVGTDAVTRAIRGESVVQPSQASQASQTPQSQAKNLLNSFITSGIQQPAALTSLLFGVNLTGNNGTSDADGMRALSMARKHAYDIHSPYELNLMNEIENPVTTYSDIEAQQGRYVANQVQDLYNNIMNNLGSAEQAKAAVKNTFGIDNFEPLGNDYRYPVSENGWSIPYGWYRDKGGNYIGGEGGNGGGGGNGGEGGDLDVIYPYETVNSYTQTMTKQLLESLLGKGLGYNKLTDQFRKYLDEAVGDVREYGDTVLNSAYDTNATALNNMMNAMRTSIGSGITSGAGAGNMLATALQAGLGQVTDANAQNASTQQNIFKYISDLQSKKADIPANAATVANATLAPIAEMLGNIYGSYLYGDVASMNDAKATALAARLANR